ncbi:hypothetical protein OCO_36330 [Mycobacterium intracellulare MOTT-02]|nr:hypothetical protein OCO_36330 [Mycobacterium intracellulare MOTT-02]AFC55265.1 hypothetical protein OCQ_37530 [Mycobacterium paraintracellulare]ETZ33452.1 hypothetical protein L843_3938 [Mycobacterium intracellulare MIN_061107_1834]
MVRDCAPSRVPPSREKINGVRRRVRGAAFEIEHVEVARNP